MSILWPGVVCNFTYRIVLYIIITRVLKLESTSIQSDAEQPWSQAFNQYTRSMGEPSEIKNLNLSTVVIHEDQVYEEQEQQERELQTLQGIRGEEIKVECLVVNGTAHERPNAISVSTSPVYKHQEVCDSPSESDCQYNFTLIQPVEVTCLQAHDALELSFKFKIDTTLFTTARPYTTHTSTQIVQIQPKLEPEVYKISPYVVKNVGEQQPLFNPE